jgi:hypothetical protein
MGQAVRGSLSGLRELSISEMHRLVDGTRADTAAILLQVVGGGRADDGKSRTPGGPRDKYRKCFEAFWCYDKTI